jgi:AmmeMemoRadiSam system protein B
MTTSVRAATHADPKYGFGSWYEHDATRLEATVSKYLQTRSNRGAAAAELSSMAARCVGVIAPHAGLRFSGPTAGVAYQVMLAALAPSSSAGPETMARSRALKRIVVLGPSHKEYFDGIGVSGFDAYDTPLGRLQVDQEAIRALQSALSSSDSPPHSGGYTSFFGAKSGASKSSVPIHVLKRATEESEHSLEMQLPFVAYILNKRQQALPDAPPAKIVPIVVGDTDAPMEERLGDTLRQVFSLDAVVPDTMLCVSSDFCHWGERFRFQHLFDVAKKGASASATSFDVAGVAGGNRSLSIGQRIEVMDHEAMDAVTAADPAAWDRHLRTTENTICGRHPIGVALRGLIAKGATTAHWVHYAQSTECKDPNDSSVSYAAAILLSRQR